MGETGTSDRCILAPNPSDHPLPHRRHPSSLWPSGVERKRSFAATQRSLEWRAHHLIMLGWHGKPKLGRPRGRDWQVVCPSTTTPTTTPRSQPVPRAITRRGSLARVVGMENGANRGPRLSTATRVLGVTADLIDACFEYVAIPISEEWTERPGGHQARVVDRESEWCGLSVTFYVNTAAVLFQGPPRCRIGRGYF